MVDRELARRIVDYMNELLALDRSGITDLVRSCVPCNESLGSHPTCQTGPGSRGPIEVGLLGILNGLCGAEDSGPRKGWGLIAAEYPHPQPEADYVCRRYLPQHNPLRAA
jgi:hypothetical protein